MLWDQFVEEELVLPSDEARTLAVYEAGAEHGAYVEFVTLGEPLPEMPLFLKPGYHVPAPLEATYQTTWAMFPAPLRGLLE